MAKDDKTDKSSKTTPDVARKIWLAGIGAYGRAFTEAKGAVDELRGKSSEVFDDLVQKGEMLEKVAEYKGKEMLDKSGIKDFDINDRIKAMREKLSGGANTGRVEELEGEVEELKAKLAALEKSQKSKKKAVRRKPIKTQKTAPKPTAKKTSDSKT